MNDIWRVEAGVEIYMKVAEAEGDESPIEVTQFLSRNRRKKSYTGLYGGHLGERPSPAAELILTVEDFDLDFFTWGGAMFVSERMRQVMALEPTDIRFFEIDDSQSAPLARLKKYQMMEPTVTETVSDPEKSIYAPEPATPDNPFGPSAIDSIAIRPDAAPTHDLFYDSFFGSTLFCTDQFALRLLEAGCTGLEFIEPAGYRDGKTPRRLTLEGVE